MRQTGISHGLVCSPGISRPGCVLGAPTDMARFDHTNALLIDSQTLFTRHTGSWWIAQQGQWSDGGRVMPVANGGVFGRYAYC